MAEDQDQHQDDQNAGDGDGGDQDAGEDKQQQSDFNPIQTREQFDAVAARIRRQERERFKDYDDVKAKADQFDKLQDEQRTQAEKDAAARATAEAERDQARQDLRNMKARTKIERAAQKAGAVDAEAVYALLDHNAIEYDDDGMPTNADALVDELLEERPFLKGGTAGTGGRKNEADQGARGNRGDGQLTREDLKTMSEQEISEARAEGKLRDVLAGKA